MPRKQMDTARFIQMANKVPMYSFGVLNRRLPWFGLHLKHVPKMCHSDNTKNNPYMKKYAEKISSLQWSANENMEINTEKCAPKCDSQQRFSMSQSHSDNAQTVNNSFAGTSQKSLGSITKLELLKGKTGEEIESIWKQYFQGKDGLYAVVPAAAYQQIISKSEEFPTGCHGLMVSSLDQPLLKVVFLYPVPKVPGYEFIVGQFKGSSCYFTTLQDYQVHKDNAHVSLTISYYPELIEEKGIVLMRGEFDDKVMKVQEAQCLANQLQMYYGGNSVKKQKLLTVFNKEPQKFQYMDLISELETSLG